MASSFDVFRKLLAPRNMEDMQRFVVRLNEALETLFDKVFGYIELSDMAKATQTIIKNKTDAEAVQQIVNEATGEGSEIRQRIDSVSASVTDLAGRTAAVEVTADDITQRVSRSAQERTNVTQTPQKWEATVYREDDPANRNYVRFGRPVESDHRDYETQFTYWTAYDSIDDMQAGVISEKCLIRETTHDGKTCYWIQNRDNDKSVWVTCVADNSETVAEAVNFGYKVYPSRSYNMPVRMFEEGDSRIAPVPLYQQPVTANTWNTVEVANIGDESEPVVVANGKPLRYWFGVGAEDDLYITDFFLEKANAAQTHAWSGWVHTPDDTSFRTFSIEREKMSAKDEAGTLGNVPSGAQVQVVINTTDWSDIGQAMKTITGLRDGMTVIVTPSPASIAECVRCNVQCVAQIEGDVLVFQCDTVPTAPVAMNAVILAGLAEWT